MGEEDNSKRPTVKNTQKSKTYAANPTPFLTWSIRSQSKKVIVDTDMQQPSIDPRSTFPVSSGTCSVRSRISEKSSGKEAKATAASSAVLKRILSGAPRGFFTVIKSKCEKRISQACWILIPQAYTLYIRLSRPPPCGPPLPGASLSPPPPPPNHRRASPKAHTDTDVSDRRAASTGRRPCPAPRVLSR